MTAGMVAAPPLLAKWQDTSRGCTSGLAWRDRDGSWHWDPDHLRLMHVLAAIEPSPSPAGAPPERPPQVSLPPSPAEVRAIARALAAATSWAELLHLAQHIWDCPVDEYHVHAPGDRTLPSARAQLCDAYRRGVERLWGKNTPAIDLFRPAAGRRKRVAA